MGGGAGTEVDSALPKVTQGLGQKVRWKTQDALFSRALKGLRQYALPGASRVAQMVKNLPANARGAGDAGSIPGSQRSPGGGNMLAWRIPRTEDPGGPQSRGLREPDTTEVTARTRHARTQRPSRERASGNQK